MGDAAVIGAGVVGLAVAQRLRERGEVVTVFEAAGEPDGRTGPWTLGDPVWDRHQPTSSSHRQPHDGPAALARARP